MGSYGVLCIFIQIFFVICVFVYSTANTKYEFSIVKQENHWEENGTRNVYLYNENFYPLMGVLAAGFYLHGMGLPILRENADPSKNVRDVFIGFSVACLNYSIVGVLGFMGFMGSYFVNNGHMSITEVSLALLTHIELLEHVQPRASSRVLDPSSLFLTDLQCVPTDLQSHKRLGLQIIRSTSTYWVHQEDVQFHFPLSILNTRHLLSKGR